MNTGINQSINGIFSIILQTQNMAVGSGNTKESISELELKLMHELITQQNNNNTGFRYKHNDRFEYIHNK